MTKRVKIIGPGVPDRSVGEEVDMPDGRAVDYCRQGLVEPIGWHPDGGPRRRVKIVNVPGYKPGEETSLGLNRALTYCRNGQALPLDWDPRDEGKAPAAPRNRMMDTRGGVSAGEASSTRPTLRTRKRKSRK